MGHNIGLKLLAFLLAVVIWMQFMLLKNQVELIEIPVRMYNMPGNLAITNMPQKTVTFETKGRGLDILLLKLVKVTLDIDGSNLKHRSNFISLTNYRLTLPKYIRLSSIKPVKQDEILIETDVMYRKVLPVSIQFEDQEARDFYKSSSIAIDPDFVEVSGPRSLVVSMKSIQTKAVSLKELKHHTSVVDLITPYGSIVLTRPAVNLQHLSEQMITRTIPLIPIQQEGDGHLTFLPQRVSVKVDGVHDVISKLKSEDFLVTVSLSEKDADGYVPVVIKAPARVKILEFTPAKVQIVNNEQ